MHPPAIPALGQGIWREPKDLSLHTYKPEGMFGNLKPYKTNGVMTLCLVLGTNEWVLLHSDNIEPIKVIAPRQPKPTRAPRNKPLSEARAVSKILDGLL